MTDVLITAPDTEPVTVSEVKSHLKIDGTDEDTLITSYITAAREWCEGYQRRKYISQTRELVLDKWPREDEILIPYGQLQSVTSLKYKDEDGDETTMSTDDYIVQTDGEPGKVVLAFGKTWPNGTLYPTGAIRIRYTCGYGDAADVPEMIKSAIKIQVGLFYDCYKPDELKAYENARNALLAMDRMW